MVPHNGDKAYVPIVYAPKEALIWWSDYLHSVSEDDRTASLERFTALSERFAHITGATVDGWDPAQNALRTAFPGMTLEEGHLHALRKLGQHVATFTRQRMKEGHPLSEAEETTSRDACVRVVQAPTPEAYHQALDELPAVFAHEPFASRKDSLVATPALFQAWTTEKPLAVVTTALDQCMKFLNRQHDTMQTFLWTQEWPGDRECLGDHPEQLALSQGREACWLITTRMSLCQRLRHPLDAGR